jgi:hypothetical protein
LYICDEEEKRILKAINKIKKKTGKKTMIVVLVSFIQKLAKAE